MPETPKNEKPTLSKRDNLLMALKYLMCTAGAGIIQFVSFTLLNTAAHFDRSVRIPMLSDKRSLNLSNSAAIAVYEVLRQTHFEGMKTDGEVLAARAEIQ